MSKPLVTDDLWETVEPLLPGRKYRPGKRGRPPVDDRAALTGIVFVLQSGIAWNMLPLEMGCGSGVTCWRRLRHWQRRGVWKKLLAAMLQKVQAGPGVDLSKVVLDSQSVRAVFGGADRQEPHGPCEKRHETPPAGGPQGHAAGGADHRGQPARLDPGDGPDRLDPADPAPRAWPAPPTPRRRLWRPGLRHAGQPARPSSAADQGPLCQAAHSARQRLGPRPPGGRAGIGLGRARSPPEDPV